MTLDDHDTPKEDILTSVEAARLNPRKGTNSPQRST
jgi:hypothetical protein